MRLRAAIYVTLFVTHLRPVFSQTKADVMNFDFTNVNDFLTLEGANETELGFDFGDGLCVPQDRLEDIEFFPNFSNGWIRSKPERKGVNSFSVFLARDDSHKGLLGSSSVEEKTLIPESKVSTVLLENGDADKGLQRSNVEEKTLIQESVRKQETKAQAKIDFETLIPESNGDQESNAEEAKIDETLIQESTSEKESEAKPTIYFKTLIPESTEKQEPKAYNGCFSSSNTGVKKRPRSHSNRKRNSLLENTQPDENRNFYFPPPKDANRSLFRVENKYIERTCSHCQVRETPQWREGPHGPKTLCNACGIKYKNGRLVEGYMPAASPSFDVNKHSNFHRRIVQKKASDQDYLGEVVNM